MNSLVTKRKSIGSPSTRTRPYSLPPRPTLRQNYHDAVDLKHLKTYKTDRPVNDAVISETKDHILLGGGQEAMSVTTTAGKVGKFETRFFHLV